ncbi:MAG TPA: hypothetical protein VFZ00_15295 [Solirubrobacter sp.]|nr:hypothetical protein [Solirubrobacter sp.]
MAERLHADDREPDGTPLLDHVRRVAAAVGEEAVAVAWLHEALEWTLISEHALLDAGISSDELRALRLLTRTCESRYDAHYLAHLELIAHAAGPSGRIAREVKIADLEDRALHPCVRHDGWSPPYEAGLRLLRETLSIT